MSRSPHIRFLIAIIAITGFLSIALDAVVVTVLAGRTSRESCCCGCCGTAKNGSGAAACCCDRASGGAASTAGCSVKAAGCNSRTVALTGSGVREYSPVNGSIEAIIATHQEDFAILLDPNIVTVSRDPAFHPPNG